MRSLVATATALLLGAPATAAPDGATGDPAAGEAAFARQCVSCHVVKDEDGTVLAGHRGRQGPNLHGVAGGPIAAVEGFNYGRSMTEAGQTDLVWNEVSFVGYIQDPTDWLRETLHDKTARSRMGWKVRDPEAAADIYAFLLSIAPYRAE